MNSLVLQVVRSFRRLPLSVVMAKIRHRLKREIRSRVSKWRAHTVGLSLPESSLLRHILGRGITKEVWLDEFLAGLSSAGYLLPQGDPGFATRTALVLAADEAMAHRFDLLGSGPVVVRHGMICVGRLGHVYHMPAPAAAAQEAREAVVGILPEASDYVPIDWHLDFISGFRWDPHGWHADITAGPRPGVDIKVPWELSRFQHLVHLVSATELTGDHRYATEIQAQILDFIHANPVGFGPCWVCPMDVAIRVSNWLVALGSLAFRGLLDRRAMWVIAKSLVDHGRFIEGNLEWSPDVNGNHYASDLAGLLYIGRFCPGLPRAERWLKFARQELEAEILKQIQPDGTDFEASTCYHRLVFEIFLHASLLEAHVGHAFSARFRDKLIAMREVLRSVCLANGEIPQIGDNDSGRFIVIDALPFHSLRIDHLIPVCDAHVGSTGGAVRGDFDRTPLWLLGWVASSLRQGGQDWADRTSSLSKDSGWVVLRRNGMECVFACGPNGQGGNGGHAHNDKLSVVISKRGLAFVVDPGNFVYSPSPALRNDYRSTRMHNTPQAGGLEINELPKGRSGLFTLPDRSRTELVDYSETRIVAEHSGFGEPVRMEAVLDENGVAIRYLVGNGPFTMRWHLHPDVRVEVNGVVATLRMGADQLFLSVADGASDFEVRDYDYSPAYGRTQGAKVLEVGFSGRMSWKIGTA